MSKKNDIELIIVELDTIRDSNAYWTPIKYTHTHAPIQAATIRTDGCGKALAWATYYNAKEEK